MLLRECADAGVAIHTSCQVGEVARGGLGGFEAATSRGAFRAESLVIAAGGLSFPKIGASDFGYPDRPPVSALGIVETRPGLVPLTWDEETFVELSGVSLPVAVRHNGGAFEENILFTHRDSAAPRSLQISSYWKPGETIGVDLLPGSRCRRMAPRQPGRFDRALELPRRKTPPPLRPALVPPPLRLPPPQPLQGPSPRRDRTLPQPLARHPDRHRGLSEGRGHPRGSLDRSPLVEDDGGAGRPGPLLHRRGRRRHRPPSAATISSGPGLPAMLRGRPSKVPRMPRDRASGGSRDPLPRASGRSPRACGSGR